VRRFANGQLLLAGFVVRVGGRDLSTVAKVNADGTLDAGFNAGTGTSARVSSLAIQPDNKVLLSGQFSTFNGVGQRRLGASQRRW
jgi:hypothetical protein